MHLLVRLLDMCSETMSRLCTKRDIGSAVCSHPPKKSQGRVFGAEARPSDSEGGTLPAK